MRESNSKGNVRGYLLYGLQLYPGHLASSLELLTNWDGTNAAINEMPHLDLHLPATFILHRLGYECYNLSISPLRRYRCIHDAIYRHHLIESLLPEQGPLTSHTITQALCTYFNPETNDERCLMM
ncbi:hypothetical protein TcWFU_002202 [Taenia crassiceps]|uniref:SOCS box domain-containing protein n=1 Tax=Taenia crassiceps TaxID=6207 RepID=A0ABR4Q714_9CEST